MTDSPAPTPSLWQRILADARYSGTRVWATLQIVFWAVIAYVQSVGSLLGDPEFKQYLQMVLSPKVLPFVMLGTLVIFKVAAHNTVNSLNKGRSE